MECINTDACIAAIVDVQCPLGQLCKSVNQSWQLRGPRCQVQSHVRVEIRKCGGV